MTEARAGGGDLLHGPHGLRAGWRIALWLLATVGLALALLPLALLAPDAAEETAGMAALALAATVAGWGMLRWVDRRPVEALGFGGGWPAARESATGFAVGAGLLAATAGVLAAAGSVRWVADAGTAPEYAADLAASLGFFLVAAWLEEALMRGYLFQALVQGIGPWPAVVATSALFALGHAGNPEVGPFALANIFLAGVLLAVAYLRTRSLWFATLLHAGWNWTMSALLDLPVSGIVRDTPLYEGVETGADWWTGGAFGPEAGAAATLALLAGTAWTLRTRRLGESPRMRAARPLIDDRIGPEWRG